MLTKSRPGEAEGVCAQLNRMQGGGSGSEHNCQPRHGGKVPRVRGRGGTLFCEKNKSSPHPCSGKRGNRKNREIEEPQDIEKDAKNHLGFGGTRKQKITREPSQGVKRGLCQTSNLVPFWTTQKRNVAGLRTSKPRAKLKKQEKNDALLGGRRKFNNQYTSLALSLSNGRKKKRDGG